MLFYTCQLLDAFVHPLTSKFLLSISFLPLSFTLILSFITIILLFFAVLELSISSRLFCLSHGLSYSAHYHQDKPIKPQSPIYFSLFGVLTACSQVSSILYFDSPAIPLP
ncbi:hypothetical protein J3E68DRAFT_410518 [Trichoderma sp. SZMC 28012]